MIRIGKELDSAYEEQIIKILKDYKDIFAWMYEDIKGIPLHICEYKIEIKPNTKPIKESRYRMNPNFAVKVKEEIDKFFKAKFIYLVGTVE